MRPVLEYNRKRYNSFLLSTNSKLQSLFGKLVKISATFYEDHPSIHPSTGASDVRAEQTFYPQHKL
jgi:hypothetical protein